MSQPNIILTGFMGTGKTTIGRLMARQLGYEFVDTDQRIEEQTGCTIVELFARQEEKSFRQMEADLALELARQQGLVISTGGGFFTNPDNIEALQASGQILCLTATAEEILERVNQQEQIRPLLQNPHPLKTIRHLLRERNETYRQFPQIVTSNKTPAQVVDMILCLLKE